VHYRCVEVNISWNTQYNGVGICINSHFMILNVFKNFKRLITPEKISIFAVNQYVFWLWLCLHGFLFTDSPLSKTIWLLKWLFLYRFRRLKHFSKTNVSSLTVYRSPQSCDFCDALYHLLNVYSINIA